MRPEKVSSWREQLPPPFDKPGPIQKRRASAARLEELRASAGAAEYSREPRCLKRSHSAPGALDQGDRKVNWLRFIQDEYVKIRRERSFCATEKLRRFKRAKLQRVSTGTTLCPEDSFHTIPCRELMHQRSLVSKSILEEPTIDELSALTSECFPPIEESLIIITEYSKDALRISKFTLEEVLTSDNILQPGELVDRVRWIHVEYYKMGTFWGSDFRFAQWGTDPALFEKSPIVLLQKRLAELDRLAGRPSLEQEDIAGYKRIGKYYRQIPGCPEFLGLRVDSSPWFKSEPYELLLGYLETHPSLSKQLQRCRLNDLQYGLAYLNAIECVRKSAYDAKPGLREVHQNANDEEVYAYGSWDDHVERLEFYSENTLLSCGSPRLYKVVADRLLRKEDELRQHFDCALLYYTLARVSIENDEMMQDAPERALNKVFSRLKDNRNTDRAHVELIFNLQQAVLDGLEYLEENQRELPIWGIPPFNNHQVIFHPEHTPPPAIHDLIQQEMDLVDRDFDIIIGHWRSLKDKVDRHLDVLLQFRVLQQQELAIIQGDMSAKQQKLAIEDARSSRMQSRSVMIFTALTIIFLPLSFFTSYFGMNLPDLAKANHDTKFFWLVSGPISGAIVIAVLAIAKILSVDKYPDEEQGVASSGDVESETSWRSRLRLRKGKMKSN